MMTIHGHSSLGHRKKHLGQVKIIKSNIHNDANNSEAQLRLRTESPNEGLAATPMIVRLKVIDIPAI